MKLIKYIIGIFRRDSSPLFHDFQYKSDVPSLRGPGEVDKFFKDQTIYHKTYNEYMKK